MNDHPTAAATSPWLDPENIVIPDATQMELGTEAQILMEKKPAALENEYDQTGVCATR